MNHTTPQRAYEAVLAREAALRLQLCCSDLSVLVLGDVVFLSGFVKTAGELSTAIREIEATPGVSRVISEAVVQEKHRQKPAPD